MKRLKQFNFRHATRASMHIESYVPTMSPSALSAQAIRFPDIA